MSLGINIEDNIKKECLREITEVSQKYWYACEFRNCDLLAIYSGENIAQKQEIHWKEYLQNAHFLKKLILDTLEPYFYKLPRIIILKSKPGNTLNWHVDCASDELDGFQPKLRILLSGHKSDLYFIDNNNNKLTPVIHSDVYYMSGAYIHALNNTSQENRYVVCFGSPWSQKDVKPAFVELLSQQNQAHQGLWKDSLQLDGRARFVRQPKIHQLLPYDQS